MHSGGENILDHRRGLERAQHDAGDRPRRVASGFGIAVDGNKAHQAAIGTLHIHQLDRRCRGGPISRARQSDRSGAHQFGDEVEAP